MKDIKTHKRVNDILLGPLERPALHWFSRHMPAWVTPDLLTLVGVLGTVVIFAGYGLSNLNRAYLWLASLGFFINWFGDSMDGTLARHRHIQRPVYGFFVDHTADAFGQLLIFAGLGLSPYMRFDIALLALAGYLMMSVLVYVRMCVSGVFRISYGRFGPTEIRAIAVLANTLIYLFGNPALSVAGGVIHVFDLAGGAIAAALITIFIVSTSRQAIQLAGQDL